MEGSFGWGWVVDLKFVLHSLKPINTDIKYFLLKVEISNPGVLKESIALVDVLLLTVQLGGLGLF